MNNIHVVKSLTKKNTNNRWAVRKEGAKAVSYRTITQREAIKLATRLAYQNKSMVIVHNEIGAIRRVYKAGYNQ